MLLSATAGKQVAGKKVYTRRHLELSVGFVGRLRSWQSGKVKLLINPDLSPQLFSMRKWHCRSGISYLRRIHPKAPTLWTDVESQEEHNGMRNNLLWQTEQNARCLREVRASEAD